MFSSDFSSQYTTIRIQPERGFLFNKNLYKWTASAPFERGIVKQNPVQIRVLQKYITENTFPLYKTNHLQQRYQWIYFEDDGLDNSNNPIIKRFDIILKMQDKKRAEPKRKETGEQHKMCQALELQLDLFFHVGGEFCKEFVVLATGFDILKARVDFGEEFGVASADGKAIGFAV